MIIIVARPPNFGEIAAAFPMAYNHGVIFAFHDAIYNPYNKAIPPELLAHEAVHLARQGGTVEGALAWWNKYINDPLFRYREELLAHRAEYQHLMDNAPSRQVRRAALKTTSRRLASPLYGRMITVAKAQKDILGLGDEDEHSI